MSACELCDDPTCDGPVECPFRHPLGCTCRSDDPHWDGTEAAHPAWWRGNDYGVRQLAAHVARWLTDPAAELARGGTYTSPDLQALRVAVITVATNVGCLRADLAGALEENERLAKRRDELIETILRLTLARDRGRD